MNITLDDTSPLIQYVSANNNGSWGTNHTGDSSSNRYFDGTFHASTTVGDYIYLRFNGSAIHVYGAKRGNHGPYTVTLDDEKPINLYGYAAPDEFQQELYSHKSLNSSEHLITIQPHPDGAGVSGNHEPGGWYFDLDYIVITQDTQDTIWSTKIDDTSPLIEYSGANLASAGKPLQPQNYYNTTAHITNHPGDSFSLIFNGSSVGVYGGLYVDHGNYTVLLDGQNAGNYNGTFYQLETQVPLFVASGLEDSRHVLEVTNGAAGTRGNFIDLDYILVNSTRDPNSSLTSGNSTGTNVTGDNSPDNSGSSSGKSSSNTGAIVGGVVGGIAALALIAIGVWWFYIRKRRARRGDGRPMTQVDLHSDEPTPYPYPDYETASPSNPTQTYDSTYGGSTHRSIPTLDTSNGPNPNILVDSPNSQMAQRSQSNFLSIVPPPPPSNVESYPLSAHPPSSDGESHSPARINPFTSGYSPALEMHNGSTPSLPQNASDRSGTTRQSPSVPSNPSAASNAGSNQDPAYAADAMAADTFLRSAPSPQNTSVSGSSGARSNEKGGEPTPFHARHLSHSTDSSGTTATDRITRPGRETDDPRLLRMLEEQDEETPTDGMLPPDYQQATQPVTGHPPDPAH